MTDANTSKYRERRRDKRKNETKRSVKAGEVKLDYMYVGRDETRSRHTTERN